MSTLTPARLLVIGCTGLCFAALVGCGGAKVLKEVEPLTTTQPIALADNGELQVALDWVIVREGPGTWAKNADWDEYLLRVSTHSNQAIRITAVHVVDSLDTTLNTESDRKRLVKASKKTAKRYKQAGVKVKAGVGVGSMMAAGAAATFVGVGIGSAVAAGVGAGVGAASGAAAMAGGLLLLGPALAVGGIVRGANNSTVNKEIVRRQTALPMELNAGEELPLDLFFPLAPSPRQVLLTYVDDSGEHQLAINTVSALEGLHLPAPDEETAEK